MPPAGVPDQVSTLAPLPALGGAHATLCCAALRGAWFGLGGCAAPALAHLTGASQPLKLQCWPTEGCTSKRSAPAARMGYPTHARAHPRRYMQRKASVVYIARVKKKGVPHHAKAGNINSCILKEGPGQVGLAAFCVWSVCICLCEPGRGLRAPVAARTKHRLTVRTPAQQPWDATRAQRRVKPNAFCLLCLLRRGTSSWCWTGEGEKGVTASTAGPCCACWRTLLARSAKHESMLGAGASMQSSLHASAHSQLRGSSPLITPTTPVCTSHSASTPATPAVLLRSDMIVSPLFLQQTIGHFYRQDAKGSWVLKDKAAFIQTPQARSGAAASLGLSLGAQGEHACKQAGLRLGRAGGQPGAWLLFVHVVPATPQANQYRASQHGALGTAALHTCVLSWATLFFQPPLVAGLLECGLLRPHGALRALLLRWVEARAGAGATAANMEAGAWQHNMCSSDVISSCISCRRFVNSASRWRMPALQAPCFRGGTASAPAPAAAQVGARLRWEQGTHCTLASSNLQPAAAGGVLVATPLCLQCCRSPTAVPNCRRFSALQRKWGSWALKRRIITQSM